MQVKVEVNNERYRGMKWGRKAAIQYRCTGSTNAATILLIALLLLLRSCDGRRCGIFGGSFCSWCRSPVLHFPSGLYLTVWYSATGRPHKKQEWSTIPRTLKPTSVVTATIISISHYLNSYNNLSLLYCCTIHPILLNPSWCLSTNQSISQPTNPSVHSLIPWSTLSSILNILSLNQLYPSTHSINRLIIHTNSDTNL